MYPVRKIAKAAGLKVYYTGKPCVNGHTANRYTSNGLCVTCAVEVNKRSRGKRRTEDPAVRKKQQERVARWRANNVDRARELSRKSQAKGRKNKPMQYRGYKWKAAGLPAPSRTIPAVCECCGQPPSRIGLALDHCHRTGKFRGWLCPKCNTGIGMLCDSVTGVRKALAYLERAR
jgi:hypothetical protein